MRLKTYVVNNLSEAMPIIKKDLGADALILNSKTIKIGGFLGLFQKEKLEIIAAVESTPTPRKKVRETPAPTKREVAMPPQREVAHPTGTTAKPPVAPTMGATPGNEDLIHELKHIKQFMVQMMEGDRLPDSIKGINQQLANQEISSHIRTELISRLMVRMGQTQYTEEQIRFLAKEELIRFIKEHEKAVEEKVPETIAFIGPTGVGKTTTIAKIAADYMLRQDKKVGLITSDTYRIAAVEQLKTYGNILNIPVRVVESSPELTKAMEELKDCDIILMDTAGRNYQQKQYIDDLEQLLPNRAKMQINLVLSLTSKYEDMRKIIDNFQSIEMDQLLLTKKDETSSVGTVLNLLHDYSIPLRYITNGQNVPDDIVTVTPELIAGFILGEDGHA